MVVKDGDIELNINELTERTMFRIASGFSSTRNLRETFSSREYGESE